MKLFIVLLLTLIGFNSFALPTEMLEKMRASTLNTYELTVLNGSENVLDAVTFVKNERRFKKLSYELADWYKVALIKRDLDPREVNKKFKDYQNHLVHLANTDDPAFKKQLIKQYQEIEGVLSYMSEADVEQIMLARIFSNRLKNLADLDKKLLAGTLSPEETEKLKVEKIKNAALALRVLSESYVMAANADLKTNKRELREKAQTIYSIILLSSFGAVPILDAFGASDSFLKVFILSLWASSSAIVAELFFDDTKVVQSLREKVAGSGIAKAKAKYLVDVFWKWVETPIKSSHKEFVLKDHLNYLQTQATTNLEDLSHKYRVLSTRKCVLAMDLLK